MQPRRGLSLYQSEIEDPRILLEVEIARQSLGLSAIEEQGELLLISRNATQIQSPLQKKIGVRDRSRSQVGHRSGQFGRRCRHQSKLEGCRRPLAGSLFGSKRRTARTTPTARLPSPDQKAQGKFEWRRAGRIISKVGSISVGLHAIDVLAHRRRRLGLKLFQIGFGIQRWTALLIKRRKPKTE
ncbi:hypothetical protein MRB53_032878 [Persea americana]|uniref:Uncharacterized protein n=1 Tax=Persea americana TaxID=3435 RepID=A0ACC2KTB9_PERAE|nr:hypothetical protein MRB53_032878 [Persea americana]